MRDIQDIKIPDLNWDAIKGEGLSNERAWEIAKQHVEFLIHYQMLSRTGLLRKGASEEARKAENNLQKLSKDYEGFFRLTQKTLAEKIKEIAIQDGDSKTLFNRLAVLADEALFHGSVAEWTEEEFKKADAPFHVKKRMKELFWVRIRIRAGEFLCLLPFKWSNKTHKSTALILKDLERKATRKWQEENGIEPRKREVPETPVEKEIPKKPDETPKETPKTPKKKIVKKKDSDENEKKVVKQIKKQIKAKKIKASEKDDRDEMLEALKVKK